MTETLEFSVCEKAFVKTDKTDAILVVRGRKLHVNKALLSYHSDFFNVLFNSEFKEKSMEEIPIKDVYFKEFATLLSMVQKHPIMPTSTQNAEKLLQLADRFFLPAAKHQVELFLTTTDMDKYDKLRIADKYGLEALCNHAPKIMTETSELTIYEKTFAKSDKTDAILVVDGKKLHVNKAFLSYHSHYFKVLFNSEFKEKSMEEIEIKDVKLEDFATVLSLVHPNPLVPTEANAEKLLELSHQFLLPNAKRHVELFIGTSEMSRLEKLRLADEHNLNVLRDYVISSYNDVNDFKIIYKNAKNFSDRTKSMLYDKYFHLLDISSSRESNFSADGWDSPPRSQELPF
ncbi:unnamed protein product [Caenorhabditis brenneri]